jgi:hypothetical protein
VKEKVKVMVVEMMENKVKVVNQKKILNKKKKEALVY